MKTLNYFADTVKVISDNKCYTSSFGGILTKSLKEVNSTQIKSKNAVNSLVAGKTENIHKTMIQMQKASISFQMVLEVRNKIIDAYNEIIKMRS